MGKQDKGIIKSTTPSIPTYEDLMCYRLYESILRSGSFISKCRYIMFLALILFITTLLFITFCLNSISVVSVILLLFMFFIFSIAFVLLLISNIGVINKLKSESNLKGISVYNFIKIMNDRLESFYPNIRGSDEYYMSIINRKTYCKWNESRYCIVKYYDKKTILTLIGLYVCGYSVDINDMTYSLEVSEFNDLMLLYEQDIALWKNKIDDILIG